MIKTKKNLIKMGGTVLAAVLMGASLFGGAVGLSAKAEETPTPIDMYLIAGQSNAAGYSALTAGYSSLTGTTGNTVSGRFENVMYGGEIDANYKDSKSTPQSWLTFSSFKSFVTTGYGRSSYHMGPEFGMAESMNETYAGETKAFIFKSAAGGTSLFDNLPSGTANYGNWYPRSRWSPDKAVTTGMQYENFVENFETVYNELKSHGYAPRVRAMIWMQGEADLGNPTGYESLIKTFIRDIRKDLSVIAEDDGLLAMPFIMGEIALTYSSFNNASTQNFVGMQRRVASEVENVYTVKTDDLIINRDNGSGKNENVGSDQYHWSAPDIRELGKRFGEKALEVLKDRPIPVVVTGRGDVTYEYQDDGSVRITLAPAKDYLLTRLSVDGEDVTANVIGGVYTHPAGTDVWRIEVVFYKEHILALTYAYNEGQVTVTGPGSSDGSAITVTAVPKEGYKVLSVTYYPNAAFLGGTELARVGETDEYKLESVPYAGRVIVETASLSGETETEPSAPSEDGPKEDEKGGGSEGLIIGLSVAGGAVVVGSAVTVTLLVRRRRK